MKSLSDFVLSRLQSSANKDRSVLNLVRAGDTCSIEKGEAWIQEERGEMILMSE